jgi:hypothetical protein
MLLTDIRMLGYHYAHAVRILFHALRILVYY